MTRRILIVNATLAGTSGTEVVTRDLALGLHRRGHRVAVFTPATGPLAEELAAAGVPVTTDLGSIADPPELVHGHHCLQTVDALWRFPEALAVFVCHDRSSPYAIPPQIDRIRRFVAVDENCLERLRDDWAIPADRMCVILNAVDLQRVPRRPPLPPAPKRALIFSNLASPATHERAVRQACDRLGIRVEVIGAAAGTATPTPEQRLGQFDLVFAKARCALEAMAAGAAVVLCDAAGMGPMVTAREFDGLRAWNFGARLLTRPVHADALAAEIGRYDPTDAGAVTDAVRREASLDLALDAYERVYEDALGGDRFAPNPWPSAWLAPLMTRVASLESELAAYKGGRYMLGLSNEDLAGLHLEIEKAPAAMPVGGRGFVRATLRNDLPDRTLGSWPPFPLTWACRWRLESAPDFSPHEVSRTPFHQPLPPGGTGAFAIEAFAPADPGRYVLRLTLVQESLRWLDSAPTPVYAEAIVTVRG